MHDRLKNPPEDLLKEKDVSQWIGLSVRTLQTYRVRGGGPVFVKLGSSVRYRRSDVESFIESGVRAHTSEVVR